MTIHFDASQFAYGSLERVALRCADGFRPVRRLGPLEAITESVRLPAGIGLDGVAYDWDRVPALRGVAAAFADPLYEMVVLMGGAQITGKTAFLQALALGYCGLTRRADCKIVHFSQHKARTFTREVLNRTIQASPAIKRGMYLDPGKNNVHDKSWRSGAFLEITWPTVENLSASSTPYMLLTDRDRMDDSLLGASGAEGKRSKEGAPESMALNRTRAFEDEGCVLVESTPGRDNTNPEWQREAGSHAMPPVDGIAGIYNSGDRRRYHVPCPHCREGFEPDFDLLAPGKDGDPMARAAAVTMTCPVNGCVIEPSWKMWMCARGEYIAEGQVSRVEADVVHYGNRLDCAVVPEGDAARRSKTASFHVPVTMASASNFTWADAVRLYAQAEEMFETTGNEEALRDFWMTKRAEPYTPKVVHSKKPMDKKALRDRAREQARKTVPDFVRFLVAAVDVQGDRFEVQVHGFGPFLEWAIVDRFALRKSALRDDDGERLPMAPAKRAEDWSVLTEEAVLRSYPLEDGSGRRMRVTATVCDFHGQPGVSANAVAYARKMKRDGLAEKFALFRGDPSAGKNRKPIVATKPDTSHRTDRKGVTSGDLVIYQTNPNHWKDIVKASLDRQEPGPGYLHIPAWLGTLRNGEQSDWFFAEMTAEIRGEDGKWSAVRARNEAFDLAYMARAAATVMGADRVNWSDDESLPKHFFKPLDQNKNVFMPAAGHDPATSMKAVHWSERLGAALRGEAA